MLWARERCFVIHGENGQGGTETGPNAAEYERRVIAFFERSLLSDN